ncbi:TraB/GumN family protein [Marinomonas posidonica]|uniref:GumN family protein n=1 Tax=Marinomonas posidonica (strain CECT 7376 / NCIMB 14433 / IVIA-Po-181) TaxID=491952 RepID=F6CUB9_MARPP|nr:TraB/GumN family protein [Marinomonas posidonica]AEF55238.1 GumN family protein [Marinomonas posidonica IVIA-Po-181]
MNTLKHSTLTLLATLGLQAEAASVWKVSNATNSLYLGGTIHVLSASDYPLPVAYDQAYTASDQVVFETDIMALSQPSFQQKLQYTMTYSDDTKIHHVLDKPTYLNLFQYLQSRGIQSETIEHFKPSGLSLLLSMQELQRLGMNSIGVDAFYAEKAQQDNKIQAWLETPDEQIRILSSLNQIDPNDLINYTLEDIGGMAESLQALKQSWRDGHLEKLAKLELIELQQDYPAIYHTLITERNRGWLTQIEHLISTPETEFIMVGALHLAGPDSLLLSLRNKGYRIEQL